MCVPYRSADLFRWLGHHIAVPYALFTLIPGVCVANSQATQSVAAKRCPHFLSSMSTLVRNVTLNDVPAITAIHADGEGPWRKPETCAISVNHRLLRPFHCHVAVRDGEPVGHAEWIVDRGPVSDPFLYLGMLQVREDLRGQGVGRRMIEQGLDLARSEGCQLIRTIPDEEAEPFYAKCGFTLSGGTCSTSVGIVDSEHSRNWTEIDSVPDTIPASYAMRIGWTQACSTHMWELCNRPGEIAGWEWQHPCVVQLGGQQYVQLRFRDKSSALVIAWSHPDVPIDDLVTAAHSLGRCHDVTHLILAFNANDRPSRLTFDESATIVDLIVP